MTWHDTWAIYPQKWTNVLKKNIWNFEKKLMGTQSGHILELLKSQEIRKS